MAARDLHQKTFTYRDTADGNRVKPLSGAQVTIRVASTPPGQGANAVVYGNRTTTDVTPLANPMTLGADGLCEFWAPIGDYDVTVHDTVAPARVADKTYGWTASPSLHGATHETSGGDTLPSILALPPIGTMAPYGGTADPNASWLLCDGRLVATATYPALFTALGHAYNGGVDPGGGNMRLPDKRGRVSIGAGTATGAAGATAKTRGVRGGEETHTLTFNEAAQKSITTSSENATHVHTMTMQANQTGLLGAVGVSADTNLTQGGTYGIQNRAPGNTSGQSTNHQHTISPSDAANPHNTLPPYEVDNYIIRAK